MSKQQYDRHAKGKRPLTIWVDEEWKAELADEAEQAREYLPDWSLSSHVRFLIDEGRGKWDRKYRPVQYPTKK